MEKNRAGNETRTRDPNLGKVVLYQLSYSRKINISKNFCTRDRHRTGTAISGNGILSPARLPIPPPGLSTINVIYLKKSGKRDSDSRPQPWQGCALPTELFPHYVKELGFLKRGAKIELIFVSTNFCSCFFETFFTKFFNIFIFRY